MVSELILTLAINQYDIFFAGSYNGKIYRSTDDGTSWTLVRSGLLGDNIECLTFDSNNYILAGSAQVYRSTNNGNDWTSLATIDRTVWSLAVNAGDTIYAGTYDAPSDNGGIFRSTNHGGEWSQVGLQNTSVSSILITSSRIFAGTYDNGIYQSYTGETWDSVNSGLTNLSVRALSIAPNGFIFVGTYGGGVYRSSQSITGIKEIRYWIPENFLLLQNYPNPFNPTTTIRFNLPTLSHVNLKVFNLLGQEVMTLVNDIETSGAKSVEFNASAIPSGIYFYRLQAGPFVETKKMLIIR
jgi:hypothetical protein